MRGALDEAAHHVTVAAQAERERAVRCEPAGVGAAWAAYAIAPKRHEKVMRGRSSVVMLVSCCEALAASCCLVV